MKRKIIYCDYADRRIKIPLWPTLILVLFWSMIEAEWIRTLIVLFFLIWWICALYTITIAEKLKKCPYKKKEGDRRVYVRSSGNCSSAVVLPVKPKGSTRPPLSKEK